MKNEIPSKVRVKLAGSVSTLDTTYFCDMIAGAFNRNGNKSVTSDEVKRQIWGVLNEQPLNEVGEYVKKHLVLEDEE